jgi:hypothetical protein
LEAVESWFGKLQQHDIPQTVNQTLRVARQIEAQEVEVVAYRSHQLRRAVAKDRRISIEDPTMRHGRKSHSQKFNPTFRRLLVESEVFLRNDSAATGKPSQRYGDGIG